MRKEKLTSGDLLCRMSAVLANIVEYDTIQSLSRKYSCGVPSTLISDFAKFDAPMIMEHRGMAFLWSTHWAGTHIHFLSPDAQLAMSEPAWESWKQDFLKYNDWTFSELQYDWCESPVDRVYYFDGEWFQEVSKETACMIWQAYGRGVIAQREKKSVTVVA